MKKEIKFSLREKKEIRNEVAKAAHKKAVEKAEEIKREYKKQTYTAIITAFGLILAFVWKDVITALMPSITTPSLLAKFPVLSSIYTALIITGLAVIGIVIVSNWAKSPEEK